MNPQGSDTWLLERLGKVTASRISDVMATTKNGWGAARANYMAQLVAERLSGRITEGFTNAAMQHGTETEPRAREAYSAATGLLVDLAGFVPHPAIEMAGASPDGYVEDEGLLEVKCPNTATHIDTLLGASIEGKYQLQMQWQMACTGRKWVDFASYDDRLPARLALHIRRVHRDEARIRELEHLVTKFLEEVAGNVLALNNLKEAA